MKNYLIAKVMLIAFTAILTITFMGYVGRTVTKAFDTINHQIEEALDFDL